MYKTSCNRISQKAQQCINCYVWHWRYKKESWEKIRNDTKKDGTREQSQRVINVSYAGTSNITYAKQHQEDDQM